MLTIRGQYTIPWSFSTEDAVYVRVRRFGCRWRCVYRPNGWVLYSPTEDEIADIWRDRSEAT